MEKGSLRRKRLVLLATTFVFVLAAGAADAQQAPRNQKPIATITVTASPLGSGMLREIQRLTVTGNKFLAVSASIPVPYGDLNLQQSMGATELGRRVKVAARLACEQIDRAYPPDIYAVIGTDDCAKVATDSGLAEAGAVVAAAKR